MLHSHWKIIFEAVEGIAGRIMGAVLAVAVILASILQIEFIPKLSLVSQIVSWMVVVMICGTECVYIALLFITKGSDNTIASMPLIAMRQPRLPKVLRPIAATVWLAHFHFIIALIYILHESTGTPHSLAMRAGVYALAFVFHFLAFGYFLLMVPAFTKNFDTIATLWRHRILISLVIAVLSTVAPLFLPIQRVK